MTSSWRSWKWKSPNWLRRRLCTMRRESDFPLQRGWELKRSEKQSWMPPVSLQFGRKTTFDFDCPLIGRSPQRDKALLSLERFGEGQHVLVTHSNCCLTECPCESADCN